MESKDVRAPHLFIKLFAFAVMMIAGMMSVFQILPTAPADSSPPAGSVPVVAAAETVALQEAPQTPEPATVVAGPSPAADGLSPGGFGGTAPVPQIDLGSTATPDASAGESSEPVSLED